MVFEKGWEGGPGRKKKSPPPEFPETTEGRLEYVIEILRDLSLVDSDDRVRLNAAQAIAKLELLKEPEKEKKVISSEMARILSGCCKGCPTPGRCNVTDSEWIIKPGEEL